MSPAFPPGVCSGTGSGEERASPQTEHPLSLLPPQGALNSVPPLSPRPLLPVVRTGRGQEEEGMDVSPSSSRSLPITSSFPKMVSVAPPAPTPGPCSPSGLHPRPLMCIKTFLGLRMCFHLRPPPPRFNSLMEDAPPLPRGCGDRTRCGDSATPLSPETPAQRPPPQLQPPWAARLGLSRLPHPPGS